jgi:RNA polymerase sigma-70 factor (ECF subfamily)
MARPIDRNAIDRWVVDHLPAALRMALRLSGDSHVAEDMVQETLCRVLRQWPRFRGESSFKTWMLQILVNVDRDRCRRLRPYQPIEEDDVADSAAPAADQAVAAELNNDVRTAVDRLPERQREVALLSWGEGLAAGEVAVVLGITEANVYATLHLARKRIAQAIGVDYARLDRP